MRKLVSFMHISLDGFTTNSKGQMDWVLADKEMFDIAGQQTLKSDTALYGRGTYEIMEAYWPTAADQPNATKHDIEHSAWYNSVQKIVVSKTLESSEIKNAKLINKNLPEEIRKMKNEKGKEIVMFGSPTLAHSLMEENLIDEYWLFINPILLGQGNPLFKNLSHEIKLRLLTSKTFASGVVCLHYETSNQI
ncbi:MAG: dihydrofolate reductase [Bacteroidales bacterium]|nr:dihydrofolate reductase [Bacteroidales bacterium]